MKGLKKDNLKPGNMIRDLNHNYCEAILLITKAFDLNLSVVISASVLMGTLYGFAAFCWWC